MIVGGGSGAAAALSSSRRADEKNLLLQQVFLNLVGMRGLCASSMLALRAVAKATWSHYVRLKPPSEILILSRTDEKKPAVTAGFLEFGRHERIRTSDPRHPMTVRYQAALHADAMKNHTTDSRCLCKRLTT